MSNELKRARKARRQRQRLTAVKNWNDGFEVSFTLRYNDVRGLPLLRQIWCGFLVYTALITPPIFLVVAVKLTQWLYARKSKPTQFPPGDAA